MYYIANVRNPGYYTLDGTTSSLYAMETVPTTDPNYTEFNTIQARVLTTLRDLNSADYAAEFIPSAVYGIDILNGTGIPAAAAWTSDNTVPF